MTQNLRTPALAAPATPQAHFEREVLRRFRAARMARFRSQYAVARALRVDESTIARWESGAMRIPAWSLAAVESFPLLESSNTDSGAAQARAELHREVKRPLPSGAARMPDARTAGTERECSAGFTAGTPRGGDRAHNPGLARCDSAACNQDKKEAA